MTPPRPVEEGLFTWPSERPQLIGARCAECTMVRFPAITYCPRCSSAAAEEHLLGDRGTLWTFTTQGFRPPSPPYDGADTAKTFQPYTLGYVELPGELMVEARLTEPDPARLSIGQAMRMIVVPYTTADDGAEILTFAFAPEES
jgi:uncharacterized OB-fold protein